MIFFIILKAIELCIKNGFRVKAQVQGWDEEKQEEVYVPLTVYSINTDGYVHFESNGYGVNYCSIKDCLYYLRPMLSMTEGEKEELLNLLFDEDAKYFYIDEEGIIDGKHTDLMKEGLNEVLFCPRNVELYSNFLNSHFLDWRGLIPMGLALEAPEGMYN